MMQLDDTSVSIANEEAANGTGIADDQRAEILSNYLRLQTTGIQPYGLSIREAGKKGLGVFASAPIKERAVIEFCHAILLGYRHRYTHDPALKQYAYWLNCNCKECKAHGVQRVSSDVCQRTADRVRRQTRHSGRGRNSYLVGTEVF
jgi:hypothetical protein